jgi:hypothetical protein
MFIPNKATYKMMEMMMLAKLVLNIIHAHDLMDLRTIYILQFNCQALQSTKFYVIVAMPLDTST